MLGARTKQVNSYGKRAQRVVNASDERRPIPNIFDESGQAPIQWAPVVSKMRKRENVDKSRTSSTTSSSSSPRIIHVQRQKPLISSVRKKRAATPTGVREPSLPPHFPDERQRHATTPQEHEEKKTARGSDDAQKRLRTPLAIHSVNIPSSPAIANCGSKRIGSNMKKRLHKPVPDAVDVDIILLDEDGTIIAKERRLSHSKIGTKRNVQSKAQKPPDSSSDSEDEPAIQPRQKGLNRQATVRRIVSDNSDSEASPVELVTPAAKLPDSPPDINVAQCQRSQQNQDIRPYASQSKLTTSYASSQQPTRLQTSSLQSSDRYAHVPSPVAYPRPLTPIRGSRTTRGVVPQLLPSPTDLDSSIDLSDFDLDSSAFLDASQHIDSTSPEYLKPLLQECHQEACGLYEFSSFIKSFPYDPIIRSSLVGDNIDHGFKKIGEASYSEVFGIGDVVLKIVPLRKETPRRQSGAKSNAHELEDPATSDARDVRKEIIVTRAMGEVCDGFVKLLKAYVVRGRYPDLLLKLWDEYSETRGSESIRPDTFAVSQVYAIIVLPNGGPDLEAYTFTSAGKTGWRQACSIFWQVSKALAHAEQLVSFEHRDLHWGQILVKDLSNDCQSEGITSKVAFMDGPAHGVQTTIIDLGLSRMDASDSNGLERVYWTPIDEEVFLGEGDYQFDVYRLMKQHTAPHWASFNPLTNVMWLHYLILKLLQSKRLRPPTARAGHTATRFTEKECYKCLVEMEGLLATCISGARQGKKTLKGQGRRKPHVPGLISRVSSGFSCAGDVVHYGVEKGWIMPLI